MRRLFSHNNPISRSFAPTSYQSSFFFNMYDPHFQQMIYYSVEFEVIIVFEVDGKTLKLYDIIGEHPHMLEDMYSLIPSPFNRIELYFSPDLFYGAAYEPVIINSGNSLMVRGRMEIKNDYIKMPITAVF